MHKKIFAIILFCFLILPSGLTLAWEVGQPIVPCHNNCKLEDAITILGNIYSFLVKVIAGPLAFLAITIGAVYMIISAGDPNKFNRGKQILILAFIGVILAFGSHMLIKTFLTILGYRYTSSIP